MRTITFLNLKGGVGKTSTVYHLAGVFSRAGLRVLLVDNDPQASLTQGFFGPAATAAVPPALTVAAVYEPGSDVAPESVLVPAGPAGVDILPGSVALEDRNVPRAAGWGDDQWGLKLFLDQAEGYDLCLIDCPPNLHLCSWAALVACGSIVVPLQAEDFGSQGLAPVQRSIEAVRVTANRALGLAGYLLTMFDRRLAVHATYAEMLRASYGPLVFEASVPRAKDFVEAVAQRKPVSLTKPRGAAAKAMQAVADELLARVTATEARDQGRGAA